MRNMKKITSLAEYKDHVRRNKARLGTVDTNCMLLGSSMEPFIAENRLFLMEFQDGIIFFIDEGDYYTLYYHWKQGQPFPSLHPDKPLIIEELNNRGARDSYLSRVEPLLLEAGFAEYRTNLQVEVNLANLDYSLSQRMQEKASCLEKAGLRFDFCKTEACMQNVLALWDEALELSDIPASHRVLDDSSSVLCIRNSANEIVAASWWHHAASSESRHIVTRKEYYRKGLASAMLCVWLTEAQQEGISRCFTWINEHNAPSLRMYETFHFVQNGRTSKQFILKQGE